jgi:hypothetical protein
MIYLQGGNSGFQPCGVPWSPKIRCFPLGFCTGCFLPILTSIPSDLTVYPYIIFLFPFNYPGQRIRLDSCRDLSVGFGWPRNRKLAPGTNLLKLLTSSRGRSKPTDRFRQGKQLLSVVILAHQPWFLVFDKIISCIPLPIPISCISNRIDYS